MALEEDPEQHEHASKKKKSDEEYEKRKKNITPGSLMKAMIRSGEGTTKPVEGDQVIFHCTIRTVDGVIVNSTRSEHGGKGYPNRYIMGKSKMLLGLCEGLPTMLKGEIAMFKMKPELHYGEVDCPVSAPEDFPKDVDLHFEIEILDFFKAKIVSEDMGVVKKVAVILKVGRSWSRNSRAFQALHQEIYELLGSPNDAIPVEQLHPNKNDVGIWSNLSKIKLKCLQDIVCLSLK